MPKGPGLCKQALQAVGHQAHGLHVGLAGTLVTAQPLQVVQGAPVFFGLDHADQLGHVGQADIQALACQGVHSMGRVAGQGKRLFHLAWHRADPLLGTGQLQRPHRAVCAQLQGAQGQAARLAHGAGKCLGWHGHQRLRPQGVHRPNQSDLAGACAAHRQQGQNLGLGVGQPRCRGPAKPLPCDALVRLFALQAGRDGMLIVGGDVKVHAPLRAGLAGTAFADHRQRCRHRGWHHFNQRLEFHGGIQTRLQRGHVHHRVEFAGTCGRGLKIQLPALIAPNLHLVHRGRGGGLGPATQVL